MAIATIDKRLETRVRGVNRANAYANEIAPKLRDLFAPYVGQKVFKADGTLLAKIQKQVDALQLTDGMRNGGNGYVYRLSSNYSVVFVVKTYESDGENHGYYHETSIYVAHVRDGVAYELYDWTTAKTDYNAAYIAVARERYEAAKKAADDARSELHPFGEYDR